ncbi:hypothetical protein JRO89_XS06G0176200 [Xanthoceras sorbifolium]|uniref:Late embryogenesis abundant protein LEA-2 subgroup domain-containing protein n=1 Tax=Xanthoceras sorbifolium TaxID=99658 RepID=A0ABQ8HYS2_9ROSI|nr:hypothetical protein JRO89_XS06G0176200 [Xanthoceras sorbifolium]
MCQAKNLYIWLLQVIGLLGLLAFCLWLSLRPRNPTVTVVELSVPPGDNGSSVIGDGNQNGTLYYNLEIQNPNKDSNIYFDDIWLTFFNGQDRAAEDKISAFKLGKDKTQRMAGRNVDVDGRVWKALRNAISNATAELKVGFVTRIRYRTWGIKSKHHGMNLQGSGKIGKDGKLLGKKKKFKLKHASKKWRVKASHIH